MVGKKDYQNACKQFTSESLNLPSGQIEFINQVIKQVADNSKSLRQKIDALQINRQLLGGSIRNITIQENQPKSTVTSNRRVSSDIGTDTVGSFSEVSSPNAFKMAANNDHKGEHAPQKLNDELKLNKRKIKKLFTMQKEINEASQIETAHGSDNPEFDQNGDPK
jgi:hypothetical protein